MEKNSEKELPVERGIIIFVSIVGAFILILISLVVVKVVNPNAFGKIGQAKEVSFSSTSVKANIDGNLTSEIAPEESPLEGRHVYYAGLEDCVVNSTSVVYLENLKENDDIYMAYEIYDNDVLIHETGLIPAGEYSKWTPAEDLEPGEHTLSIKNIPYYGLGGDDYEPLAYQPINMINMTILE